MAPNGCPTHAWLTGNSLPTKRVYRLRPACLQQDQHSGVSFRGNRACGLPDHRGQEGGTDTVQVAVALLSQTRASINSGDAFGAARSIDQLSWVYVMDHPRTCRGANKDEKHRSPPRGAVFLLYAAGSFFFFFSAALFSKRYPGLRPRVGVMAIVRKPAWRCSGKRCWRPFITGGGLAQERQSVACKQAREARCK